LARETFRIEGGRAGIVDFRLFPARYRKFRLDLMVWGSLPLKLQPSMTKEVRAGESRIDGSEPESFSFPEKMTVSSFWRSKMVLESSPSKLLLWAMKMVSWGCLEKFDGRGPEKLLSLMQNSASFGRSESDGKCPERLLLPKLSSTILVLFSREGISPDRLLSPTDGEQSQYWHIVKRGDGAIQIIAIKI